MCGWQAALWCFRRAVETAHSIRVWRLAAWAEVLNGEQAQTTAGALVRDRVMAALTIDRIGRGALSAGLTDVQQWRWSRVRRAPLLIHLRRLALWIECAGIGSNRLGDRHSWPHLRLGHSVRARRIERLHGACRSRFAHLRIKWRLVIGER